jgi:hypothetical protein
VLKPPKRDMIGSTRIATKPIFTVTLPNSISGATSAMV